MRYLTQHVVTLALYVGLDRAVNGELIKQVEERGFEVFVPSDKNLSYQQNLKGRKLAIVVLPAGRWPEVENQIQAYTTSSAMICCYPAQRPPRHPLP